MRYKRINELCRTFMELDEGKKKKMELLAVNLLNFQMKVDNEKRAKMDRKTNAQEFVSAKVQ